MKDLANSKDINSGDREILIKLKEMVQVMVPVVLKRGRTKSTH